MLFFSCSLPKLKLRLKVVEDFSENSLSCILDSTVYNRVEAFVGLCIGISLILNPSCESFPLDAYSERSSDESGNGSRMTTLAGRFVLRELLDGGLNWMMLSGRLSFGEWLVETATEVSPDLIGFSFAIWSTEWNFDLVGDLRS